MPKFSGTIYEVLSAPVSPTEIVLGYVGAAATKSVLLGTLIGPLVERHFRQGLTAANGDLTYFVSQPIAAGIWIAVLLIVVGLPLLRWWLGRRSRANPDTVTTQQHPSV